MAIRKPLTAMMSPGGMQGDTYVYGSLFVVCDDSAVFSYNWKTFEWVDLPPVPGTKAEENATTED